jgi:glyoxylase I family protein
VAHPSRLILAPAQVWNRVVVRISSRGAGGYGGGVLVADIHHVSLNVTDVERALAFYRGVLGMAALPRPAFSFGGAWLDAGNGRQIHLIEADVPANHGQHVAFLVSDVDAVIAALRSHGVEVRDAKRVGDTAIRQTFVHDPDGNLLEFTQPA